MTIPELIDRIGDAGYVIIFQDGQASLRRASGNRPLEAALFEELRRCKKEVFEYLSAGAVGVDPFHEGPIASPRIESRPASFVTCSLCSACVCPAQLKLESDWRICCGRVPVRQKGQWLPGCPFRPEE